jgi:hypothetical protein
MDDVLTALMFRMETLCRWTSTSYNTPHYSLGQLTGERTTQNKPTIPGPFIPSYIISLCRILIEWFHLRTIYTNMTVKLEESY